ncbi:MAG TPA: hypothetical protein VJT32_01165 [bacterium]|nr:hypothetical protein [bacterium]
MAVTLGILMTTLTLSGVGRAQGVTTVQGTIQAVDCQTNALVLNASDGTHVFPAGPYTAAYVNSTPVNFCALQRYAGSSATVSVTPNGNQWQAERVDVYVAAAPGPVYPAPTASAAPSWAGIVLGTIVVAGLVYLLVRGHDGRVYRYPYHGGSYRNDRSPSYQYYGNDRSPSYQYYQNDRSPSYHYYRNDRSPSYQYYRNDRSPSYQPYWDPRRGPAYRYGPAQRCDQQYRQWCNRDAGDSNR